MIPNKKHSAISSMAVEPLARVRLTRVPGHGLSITGGAMKAWKSKAQVGPRHRNCPSRAGRIAATSMITIAAACSAISADARLTRLVITERLPFAGGAQFATVGAYERLKGTALLEVDPNNALNAVITDLDKAPRNARGMVEFSSPFFIIKPVDMSRSEEHTSE